MYLELRDFMAACGRFTGREDTNLLADADSSRDSGEPVGMQQRRRIQCEGVPAGRVE